MTGTNWDRVAIIIAAIIAAVSAVVGPCAAVILKARIDQPRPKPKTNQPKSLEAFLIIWANRMTNALFVIGLSSSLLLLVVSLLVAKPPLNRWDVLWICYAVGGLYYHPLNFLFLKNQFDSLRH